MGGKRKGLIFKIYNGYKKKKRLKTYEPYMELSKQSILGDAFGIDIREPLAGRKYIKIGNNSIVNGNFVFETKSGYVSIGDRVYIGGGSFISKEKITIEDDVIIAWGCTVYDHNSHSVYWDKRKNDVLQTYKDMTEEKNPIKNKDWRYVNSKEIIIRKRAWIGFDVTILKGVTIGEGAVVGAKSVITKDVPPYTVVGGNPARVLKTLDKA